MYTQDKFGSFLLLVLFVVYLNSTFASSSAVNDVLVFRQDSNLTVSEDGSCGGSTGQTCKGSTFGDCCSGKGYCGGANASDVAAYCQADCQPEWGTCASSETSSDGSCGGPSGTTCLGSDFGDCCSQRGYCGSNSSYCGSGCNSQWGKCGSMDVSSDGTCGGPDSISCQGSDWGNCCSARGFCGLNSSYCGSGCQSNFGTCFPGASHSSVDLSSATAGPTNTGAPTNSSAPSSGGISSGAIAGAVVGAISGICLAGLGMFLVWRKRRAQKQDQVLPSSTGTRDASLHGDPKILSDLHMKEVVHPQHGTSESAPAYHEMPIGKGADYHVKGPVEMDTSQAFEMPAESNYPKK